MEQRAAAGQVHWCVCQRRHAPLAVFKYLRGELAEIQIYLLGFGDCKKEMPTVAALIGEGTDWKGQGKMGYEG